MKFRPKLMAFTLASMPHKNAEEACQAVLCNFPEVLPMLSFFSPLPWRSLEGWRYLEGMPCLNIDRERKVVSFDFSSGRESELVEFYERYLAQDLDYFAISPEWIPALYKLAQMLKEKPSPELKLIRFSVSGPYTFGLIVKDESGVPAFYNDTMRDVMIKQLTMKGKWLEREIKGLFPGVQTMLFLSEAGLGVYSSAGGIGSWDVIKNAINEVMRVGESITGIHCCDNFDWSLLMETNTDIINFDAYRYGETMSLYPDALKRFLGRGGMIAWGIIPTSSAEDIENESPRTLVDRLERVIQLVVDRGIDEELLLESSWITPTCVTNTLSIKLSDRVFDFTKEVSQRMREKYFG